MDEISPKIQGVRMASPEDGTNQLMLITLNQLWADILRCTLIGPVLLGYTYDGSDITFYLVFELPHIDKVFKVPVNASIETKRWLGWIDQKTVTTIWIAYPDGKGGIKPDGEPINAGYVEKAS